MRGIDGDRIHIYFDKRHKKVKSYVDQGILAKKRLQTHSYDTVNDLLAFIEQTISIDGVLIVCSSDNLNSISKKVNNQKNVKLVVFGDGK